MANNRLYIGNKITGNYYLVARSTFATTGWQVKHDVEDIIKAEYDNGTFPGESTDLVLFTEAEHDQKIFHTQITK